MRAGSWFLKATKFHHTSEGFPVCFEGVVNLADKSLAFLDLGQGLFHVGDVKPCGQDYEPHTNRQTAQRGNRQGVQTEAHLCVTLGESRV